MNRKVSEVPQIIFESNKLPEIDPNEILEYPKSNSGKKYIMNIDEGIGAPSEYRRHFKLFREAKDEDIVIIKINSYGGILDTAVQFARCIKDSQAFVQADITTACSAATLIAMACDHIVMDDLGTFMVHNFSTAQEGKGQELKSKSDFDTRSFKLISNYFYAGILSKAEIRNVCNDKDYWFTGVEFNKRLEKYKEHRNK